MNRGTVRKVNCEDYYQTIFSNIEYISRIPDLANDNELRGKDKERN